MSSEIALSKFLIWISKIEHSVRSYKASRMFHKNFLLNNPGNRTQCNPVNIVFAFGALCIMFLLYHLSTFTQREHVIASYNSPEVLNITADYFKSPNYLYRSSLYVMELGPPKHKRLVDSKDPVVIVYYAPWCGHCRHFVPAYNGLAQTVNTEIANYNRNKAFAAHKHFKNVTFASVNCVDQKSICQEIGIGAYPTVIVYHIKPLSGTLFSLIIVFSCYLHYSGPVKRSRNYGTKKAPDSETFGSKDDEIKNFILSNYYLSPHFSIIPPSEDELLGSSSTSNSNNGGGEQAASKSVSDGAGEPKVAPPAVEVSTAPDGSVAHNSNINSLSRIASPTQRLEDGLTSFHYLLLSELPDTMNAVS